MHLLETNLDCAGICKLPYFWFFRKVSEGQPTQTCAIALKTFYDETIGILAFGILCSAIIGFFLLGCACGMLQKRSYVLKTDESESITSNNEGRGMDAGF